MLYALCPMLLALTACTPLFIECQQRGFTEFSRAYASLPTAPDLDITVELDKVTVHIVGDRSKFDWEKAARYGSPVAGYATSENEIWIFGTRVNGKIVINQAILGHELNHLLNFKAPDIANPDRLTEVFKQAL